MRRLLLLAALLLSPPAYAQLYQVGDDLPCEVLFLDSDNDISSGLTVTVDVYRDTTLVVDDGAVTETGSSGLYRYVVDGATYVTAAGLYKCVMTDGASSDSGAVGFAVAPAHANLDASISSRSDFDETTDPVELLDSGGSAGTSAAELVADLAVPTAAAVSDQVWTEAIADHSGSSGSTAEALDGAGGDPLSSAVPGAYAGGTAGYKLGLIGAASITVSSPVDLSGNVTLWQGADEPEVDFDNTAGTWPDLTGATVTIYLRSAKTDGTDFSKALTVVTPTGSQKVRLVITDTEADDLQPGTHAYQLWAVLSDAQERVLQTGLVTIRRDARP